MSVTSTGGLGVLLRYIIFEKGEGTPPPPPPGEVSVTGGLGILLSSLMFTRQIDALTYVILIFISMFMILLLIIFIREMANLFM